MDYLPNETRVFMVDPWAEIHRGTVCGYDMGARIQTAFVYIDSDADHLSHGSIIRVDATRLHLLYPEPNPFDLDKI